MNFNDKNFSNMFNIIRTDADNADFIALTHLLDDELHGEYGAQMAFYGQFNKIDKIKHVLVAYINDAPVGCGAIKRYEDDTAEVKRMFVKAGFRGQQIAMKILEQLELWAKESGYSYCILETGQRQQRAIALYLKNGYEAVPNYGQYIGVESSICLKKKLC
jgi:putative acetyltransferase